MRWRGVGKDGERRAIELTLHTTQSSGCHLFHSALAHPHLSHSHLARIFAPAAALRRRRMASPPNSASAIAGPSNLGASSSSSGSAGGANGSSSNSSTPAALLPPAGHPNDWTSNEVTQWLASLQPPQSAHATSFRSNGITGDVILQLDAEALRDLNVVSVGHRLTLLGAIYKLKVKWGISIEEGDWRPGGECERGEVRARRRGASRMHARPSMPHLDEVREVVKRWKNFQSHNARIPCSSSRPSR